MSTFYREILFKKNSDEGFVRNIRRIHLSFVHEVIRPFNKVLFVSQTMLLTAIEKLVPRFITFSPGCDSAGIVLIFTRKQRLTRSGKKIGRR